MLAKYKLIGGVAAGVLAIGAGGAVFAASEHGGQPAQAAAPVAPLVADAPAAATPLATPTGGSNPTTAPVPGDGKRQGLKSILDQLVTENKINQSQEDLILQRVQAQFANRPGKGAGPHGFLGIESKAVADLLKITPAQLRQDVRNGQSLHQIAQAQGVTDQQLMDTITAAAKTRLDQAVTDKKITADQETAALQRLKDRLPQLITMTFPNRPNGRGPRGANPSATATPTK
jgi:hypothetical protein